MTRRILDFAQGRTSPSPELIRKLIRFDGERYYWNPRPKEMFPDERSFKTWNTRFAGKETLRNLMKSTGYFTAAFFGQAYLAHRVIWAYHYGEWPTDQIDHINGDKTDNRLENLRSVTNAENCKNKRTLDANLSGVTGVGWHRAANKWYARIGSGYRNIYLGVFDNFDGAVAARKNAEIEHGFHQNHGRAA
jgi:HNH endonuclease